MFSWEKPGRIPIVVAHRGSSVTAPENTLVAFQQAIDDGADAIELDVRLSKDNHVIVIHDATLKRTTNGMSNVRDCTLKELKQFSAGSWFHKRYSSERILSLAEVFDLVPGSIGINIEIKTDHGRRNQYGIVEQCLALIHRARRSKSVLISSFHHPYLRRLKLLDSSIPVGCLYHPVKHFARSPVALASSLKANFLIVNRKYSKKRVIQQAHKSGLFVGEYTVDTKRRVERSMRFGVDAIYTNNPAKIIATAFPK